MSQVVVLGSGTSNGVPMLGVRYADAFLANPKNHRTRSSIVIQGPGGNLLVDCAPEMRMQLVREGIFDVEAVIITHTHADHVMGMDDLRSFCIVHKRDIPVFTLPRYQDDIKRIYPYAFREFPPGIEVPRFDLQDCPEEFNTCGLQVKTFIVDHGEIPCIALRVNDFAYLTDVSNIPDAVWPKLEGLDTLILDAVRYKPHPNHFHFERAVEVAQQIGAKQTYFTHLSHDYDHDIVNAELPKKIQLAFDGMRIGI